LRSELPFQFFFGYVRVYFQIDAAKRRRRAEDCRCDLLVRLQSRAGAFCVRQAAEPCPNFLPLHLREQIGLVRRLRFQSKTPPLHVRLHVRDALTGLAANALLRAERRRSNFLVLPGSTEVDIGASILDRLTQVVQKRPRFKPWRNGMDITRRSADKWIVDFGAI
jgi:hypothetical protein